MLQELLTESEKARLSALVARLKPHGLSKATTQYAVLGWLAALPEQGASFQDLMGCLELSASDISRVAGELAKAGLVRKLNVPTDRREVYLQLTDAGREVSQRATPVVQRFASDLASAFTPDQVKLLSDLLRRLQLRTTGNERQSIGG